MISRLSPGRQGLFKDSWRAAEIRYKSSRVPGSIYVPTGNPPPGGWPLVVTDLGGDLTAFEAAYRKCVIVRCPKGMPYPNLYAATITVAERRTTINKSKVAFFQSPVFRLPHPNQRPTLYPVLLRAKVFTYVHQFRSWDSVNHFSRLDSAISTFLGA